MKRRRVIFRVMNLLLLGAVINSAVAWAFAARRATVTIERNEAGCFVIWDRPWQVVQEKRMGMTDVWWADLRSSPTSGGDAVAIVADYERKLADLRVTNPVMMLGSRRDALGSRPRWGTLAGNPISDDVEMGGDIAFGFPLRSLWMSTTSDLIGNATANERLWGGWTIRGQVESRGNQFFALPYRVIVTGFALDTLFYAAMVWMLYATPMWLRRRRRIRRGLCPACAYPIGSSDVCTECGQSLRLSRV